LDRLIDHEQGFADAPNKPYGAVLSDIKENIRRDLENLLNTRLHLPAKVKDLKDVQYSVINYGLPDFSMVPLSAEEGQAMLREHIQSAVHFFEPRLRRVNVELANIGESYERTMYLKISAVLMIEPDPVPLLFDSRVQNLDKRLKLREVNHG
jgi:type VI secretion system protein ImpF